jgi:hypothetical protein
MSMEVALVAVLKVACAQTYPDVAPPGTVAPYLTWQGVGGRSIYYTDATPADKRNTLMQVRAWASTRLEALTLAHQVEDLLCASSDLTVIPQGEPVSVHEPETNLYGSMQRFSIWSVRPLPAD